MDNTKSFHIFALFKIYKVDNCKNCKYNAENQVVSENFKKNMATEEKNTWQETYKQMLNRKEKRTLKETVCEKFGITAAAFYMWVSGKNRCPHQDIVNEIFGIVPETTE